MGMSVPRAQKATSKAATGQVAKQQPAKGVARAKRTTAEQATETPTTDTQATNTKATGTQGAGTKATGTKATGTKATGTKATESGAGEKPAAVRVPAPEATSKPVAHKSGPTRSAPASDARAAFLERQRELLRAERLTYNSQAAELKAQADSLALEHEPGDVQFDEEGGEGGTSNVDRELDLILSGQALAAITEIDLALGKIEAGTYGICEQCGKEIPEPRLEALPHASLCVSCKTGGLSSRR
jgi:DnaK suppressor protein